MIRRSSLVLALSFLTWWAIAPIAAQDDAGELAKKLANPVASLISFPFQLNPDVNLGSDDAGERMALNIQPVISTALNGEWNLISRIITPVVFVDDIFPARDRSSVWAT